ncbi:MAG: SLBB domain-containing protein [Paludibacteraceae bacterium]|nr:SLBB domain-containing protein [Paludibacteraceae bacterium]
MKRYSVLFSLLFAAFVGCEYVCAQTLSDKEVLNHVIELRSKGYQEMEIAKALIKEGVSVEQLQRVRQQAMQLQSSVAGTEETVTAGRTNNGEMPQANDRLLLEMMSLEMEKNVTFGQDIFRKKDLNFEPRMNVATPQNYVLGPDDEVIIDIYGASQQQYKLKVSPDGFITIPSFGPVNVIGLTITQATAQLRKTLGSRYQDSSLRLSLGQTRTIMVNVMGEVAAPGSYQLSAFASVFHALYVAGGVGTTGTLRNIKVFRDNTLISTVDIYDYLLNGQLQGNVMLQDGDAIIVGTYDELVSISGKVKRPMRYEMKSGETLEQLLYYAGGFSGDAYTATLRIARRNAGAMSVHTVRNEQFGAFALMDGDSVMVDSLLPRLKNTVEIRGAVFREGYYGMSEELKTVKDLVMAADSLTEDAFATRAVLYRMKPDRTYQAVPVALQDIIEGKTADVELRNEDQLFVPSQQAKLERQFVVVYGEVFNPDTFRFAEHESVEDLILRAGGLTDRASTSKVDVARRVIDPKATDEQTVKTKTFTVELHDSLLLGEHGFILEPFDEVYVRMSPAYGKQQNVKVSGEILFEGNYSLKTQDDRLSDLVKVAGGVSSHAYVKGARLKRVMTEDEKIRRDQLVKINKAATKDSVDMDKLEIGNTYYVGIDLEAAIANPGCDDDIVLREGDELFIPSMNNTVKIQGEVLYPNTVSFVKGKRASYYVRQAGGYSNNARRCYTYVIYSGGKVQPARSAKIEPGCEIVVPSKPERKYNNPTQWVSIASMSASMASVVATIVAVIKK